MLLDDNTSWSTSKPRWGDGGVSRAERSRRTALLLGQSVTCANDAERHRILDQVVLLNRGVAESIASRYLGRGIPKEDLIQVAYEALIKAVRRFDPTSGNDLLTFAVPTIRGELMRHFRDHGWTVRPPRAIQENQRVVNLATEELEHKLGREPTHREVQEAVDLSEEEYREVVEAFGCFHPSSLDQPLAADSAATLADVVAGGDDDTELAEMRALVHRSVSFLPQRDRLILKLRFVDDLTQTEIGKHLGITQMQVSRLLARILDRLRDDIGEVTAA